MRSNATCPECRAPVRIAQDEGGGDVMLHPTPIPDGYIYFVGPNRPNTVRVVGRRAEVPGNEPFAFRIHLCGYVDHPRGGA